MTWRAATATTAATAAASVVGRLLARAESGELGMLALLEELDMRLREPRLCSKTRLSAARTPSKRAKWFFFDRDA